MRRIALILWVAVGALGAANGFVYVQGRPPPSVTRAVDPWERWRHLDVAQRAAHLRSYQALAQQGDAAAVLRHARQFAQLPPQRRQALRELQAAFQDVLQWQGPVGRKDLLRSTPRARAFFVYQTLAATDPERLARLGEQLEAGS